MRGTPIPRIFGTLFDGIIPAYAGNTTTRSARKSATRDHPRVCGEHLVVGGEAVTSAGSSPRMRGTRVDRVHGDFVGGIIPAYAGNTSRTTRTAHGSRDHPRVCGEHIGKTFTVGTAMGSSPRMRGTLDGHWGDARAAGIIPAYAGNTALSAGVVGGVGDHPRVCGEHARRVMALTPAEGSSPRMRGTRRISDAL